MLKSHHAYDISAPPVSSLCGSTVVRNRIFFKFYYIHTTLTNYICHTLYFISHYNNLTTQYWNVLKPRSENDNNNFQLIFNDAMHYLFLKISSITTWFILLSIVAHCPTIFQDTAFRERHRGYNLMVDKLKKSIHIHYLGMGVDVERYSIIGKGMLNNNKLKVNTCLLLLLLLLHERLFCNVGSFIAMENSTRTVIIVRKWWE